MADGDQDVASRGGRPARAAAVTLALSLAVLTAGLGYVDGTGLFAPENWLDAGLLPTHATSPAWATVVYLPLLVGGAGLVGHRVLRRLRPGGPIRWAFWATWSSVVLTAFLAKLLFTPVPLAVAGPHGLHLLPAIGAVLAECGLSAAKYALLGLVAAGPAAVAYRVSDRRPTALPEPGETAPMWSPLWFLVGAVVAAKACDSTFAWVEGAGHRVVLPLGGAIGAVVASRLAWTRFRAHLTTGAGDWARCGTASAASALGFLLHG